MQQTLDLQPKTSFYIACPDAPVHLCRSRTGTPLVPCPRRASSADAPFFSPFCLDSFILLTLAAPVSLRAVNIVQAYFMLDELLVGGEMLETSKKNVRYTDTPAFHEAPTSTTSALLKLCTCVSCCRRLVYANQTLPETTPNSRN